ncbi:MAG: cupin domain-containing protein [Actinomycetota bacterium]|nr:cupin domain-containing protein [Actinomycetota bacterium]
MQHVASWDWEFEGAAGEYAARSVGYSSRTLVGRSVGAVHTDVGLRRLSPGGRVDGHVHSYESCAYVLDGRPIVEVSGRSLQLGTGDYVLFPVGVDHGWRNDEGEESRWLEVATPLPGASGEGPGGADTFFLPGGGHSGAALVPDLADPTTALVGRYAGTPPQHEALAVADRARGRRPAGMDTAILAYSGISVKMMVDATLGADLLTMFMVDYEPGGAAQVHDHPFEEVYFFLEGEIEGEIDGEVRTYRAGEVLFCGVGVVHGFFNTGTDRVRWIETQAPQPPRRHSYRWPAHWGRLAEKLSRPS